MPEVAQVALQNKHRSGTLAWPARCRPTGHRFFQAGCQLTTARRPSVLPVQCRQEARVANRVSPSPSSFGTYRDHCQSAGALVRQGSYARCRRSPFLGRRENGNLQRLCRVCERSSPWEGPPKAIRAHPQPRRLEGSLQFGLVSPQLDSSAPRARRLRLGSRPKLARESALVGVFKCLSTSHKLQRNDSGDQEDEDDGPEHAGPSDPGAE